MGSLSRRTKPVEASVQCWFGWKVPFERRIEPKLRAQWITKPSTCLSTVLHQSLAGSRQSCCDVRFCIALQVAKLVPAAQSAGRVLFELRINRVSFQSDLPTRRSMGISFCRNVEYIWALIESSANRHLATTMRSPDHRPLDVGFGRFAKAQQRRMGHLKA